jgi:hypothetical protein
MKKRKKGTGPFFKEVGARPYPKEAREVTKKKSHFLPIMSDPKGTVPKKGACPLFPGKKFS